MPVQLYPFENLLSARTLSVCVVDKLQISLDGGTPVIW